MSKIPVTNEGFNETASIEAGTVLRQGWDILRSLQFNKTASILRYTILVDGKPQIGKGPTKQLVAGLSNLPVHISQASVFEASASSGSFEISDLKFYFWDTQVLSTDQIVYAGKTYNVIGKPVFDADVGPCVAIGRMI